MQLCMNDVTIMKHEDLLTRIAAAGEADYPAMEIRKAAILQALREGHRIADIRGALEKAGIELACVNAVESITFNGKRGGRVLLEAAEYLFYLTKELGCDTVEVIGSFKAPTEDPEEIKKETAESLLRLSDVAKPYGIRLALFAVISPVLIGLLLGPNGIIGMLCGATVTGFMLAVFMSNSGGAWDNAKKYIESGNHGGKGSDQHKAAVVGDTVGDPLKDTSGPAINILIKLISIVSIVFAYIIMNYHLL